MYECVINFKNCERFCGDSERIYEGIKLNLPNLVGGPRKASSICTGELDHLTMLLLTFTCLHKYLTSIKEECLSSNLHTHNSSGVFLSVAYWPLDPSMNESENVREMEKIKSISCLK